MSVQVMLFSSAVFLFMLLLMCCGSGGVVCAEKVNSVSQSNSVELFKKGETKVSKSATVAVTSFRAHSLVDVNGLMVALAAAQFNCDGLCCNTGLWSKPLKYENDKMPSEIIKTKDGSQWMAQAAATEKTDESYCTKLSGPSAVVKDDKIYILLRNDTTPKNSKRDGSNASLWDLELVVGTVKTSTDGSPNTITWDPSKSLKDTLQNKPLTGSSRDELRVIVGKGIVMGGSTILFPLTLQNISREGNGACTVIYSEDDGRNWNFPSENVIDEDCRHATLLEWEGKLLMIPASSPSSRTREVHVSADKGKTWTEYTEADSNLLINFLKRADVDDISDVIPATISDRKVTLLTQRRSIPSSGGSESRHQVHLLMTDNKRITSMGPISLDKGISSVCKLLLTKENGELFALCDKGPRDSPESVVLLSLTQQVKRISPVLESWEYTDEEVSNICIYATNGAPCSTPMPTSGLVGFLSDTGDSTQWSDEYFGVSARVTGGTNVENGFKLSGTGAKVEWEVGNDPPTPRYSFAYRGLTLVATVTIHNIPKSDIPLMRVVLTTKTVGLWYGKENHWKGLSGEGEVTTGTWEKDKPYQVVITVLNGTGSVYIDGKRLGSLEPNFQPNEDGKAQGSRDVSHEIKEEVRDICFGGCVSVHDGDGINAESSFTVTNVFLYNRVLNDTELLPPPPPPPQQQDQSQSTAEKTIEKTITGNSTVEEPADEPPQQEKDQSQSTAEEKKEATITGSLTVEEQTDTTPQQKKEQSQSTAEETEEATITGNSTVEERTDTTPQQEKDQSQPTVEGKKEATITGNSTVEEQTDTTPQQEKDQSQPTAEGKKEATITGSLTVEERTDTTPAGNDSSVHESLSSLFQLFALLAFLGSASL